MNRQCALAGIRTARPRRLPVKAAVLLTAEVGSTPTEGTQVAAPNRLDITMIFETMTCEEFVQAAATSPRHRTVEAYAEAVATATLGVAMNPDSLTKEELVGVVQQIALTSPDELFLSATITYTAQVMKAKLTGE